MSFFQRIIDFFRRLFGGRSRDEDAPALGAGAPVPEDDRGGDRSSSPARELSPAERELEEVRAFVAEREEAGLDLGAVDAEDPTTMWLVDLALERTQWDGGSREAVLAEYGFADEAHLDEVRRYVEAKWSELSDDGAGDPEVTLKPAYVAARAQAEKILEQRRLEAAVRDDPELLAPEAGITLEAYAAAAWEMGVAGMALTPQKTAEILARHGMDLPRWETVNQGFQTRMNEDATGLLRQQWSKAYEAAQNADGGDEPCSFEKYIEVDTAMDAWKQAGMDVDGQLTAVFGINLAGASRFALYWTRRLMEDEQLGLRYGELREKYQAEYASAAPDDDLSLRWDRPPGASGDAAAELEEMVERARAFVPSVDVRATALIAEARRGMTEIFAAHPTDPVVIDNAFRAMSQRYQRLIDTVRQAFADLDERILSLPHDSLDSARYHQLRDEMLTTDESLREELGERYDHLSMQMWGAWARRLQALLAEAAATPATCSQCSAPFETGLIRRSVNLECPHCGASNTVAPAPAAQLFYNGQGLHSLVRERCDAEYVVEAQLTKRYRDKGDLTAAERQAWLDAARAYWTHYHTEWAQLDPEYDKPLAEAVAESLQDHPAVQR